MADVLVKDILDSSVKVTVHFLLFIVFMIMIIVVIIVVVASGCGALRNHEDFGAIRCETISRDGSVSMAGRIQEPTYWSVSWAWQPVYWAGGSPVAVAVTEIETSSPAPLMQ